MEALMPIITQLIAGAVGGNVAGAALKQAAVSVIVVPHAIVWPRKTRVAARFWN